jgi:SNF2 family DNA or RNA helicase
MYGKIDADALLTGTRSIDKPCAESVRKAALELEDLLIHGAILADEVGLRKTKQSLLISLIHSFLNDHHDLKTNNQIFRPSLLVVPPSLVIELLKLTKEVRSNFRAVRLPLLRRWSPYSIFSHHRWEPLSNNFHNQ